MAIGQDASARLLRGPPTAHVRPPPKDPRHATSGFAAGPSRSRRYRTALCLAAFLGFLVVHLVPDKRCLKRAEFRPFRIAVQWQECAKSGHLPMDWQLVDWPKRKFRVARSRLFLNLPHSLRLNAQRSGRTLLDGPNQARPFGTPSYQLEPRVWMAPNDSPDVRT